MSEKIIQRLKKDRPSVTISMRVPEDVLADLRTLAPLLGLSGYQSLIKAYISQGLRRDWVRVQEEPLRRVAESLERQGVGAEIIQEALKAAWGRPDRPYPQDLPASRAREPDPT